MGMDKRLAFLYCIYGAAMTGNLTKLTDLPQIFGLHTSATTVLNETVVFWDGQKYNWWGPPPSQEMAEQLRIDINEYVTSHIN